MVETATFELGDIIARPYQPDDADGLLAAVRESVDTVGRWLPWCSSGYSASNSAEWIAHCARTWASGEQFAFAIFDGATQELSGAVGLSHRIREHNFASIGYWIRPSHRGRGSAARVARRVAAFGFQSVGLTRIEIIAAVDNHESRRTAENVGARFEGVARNRLRVRDDVFDAAVYALVPSDP